MPRGRRKASKKKSVKEPSKKASKSKTILGIPETWEAALAYLLGWLTGLIFLLIEKENKYVKFHAMQSLATFITLTVASIVLGAIPVVGVLLSPIIGLISIVLWLWLMYKAFSGEKWKVPYIGDVVEKNL